MAVYLSAGAGFAVYAPFIIYLCLGLFKKNIKLDYFVVSLAFFIALNAAAMAYGRGKWGAKADNRYHEILIIGLIVNLFCYFKLLETYWKKMRLFFKILAIIWILVFCDKLSRNAWIIINETIPGFYAHQSLAQQNIRSYLETGDKRLFIGKHKFEISYPYTNILIRYLNDPGYRDMLPLSLNPDTSHRHRLDRPLQFVLTYCWLGLAPAPILLAFSIHPVRTLTNASSDNDS